MRAALMTTAALAIALPLGLAAPVALADTTAPAAAQTTNIDAETLIGRTIYNAQNEEMGEVESVILDDDGNTRYVIAGVGGFLGVGEKSVALEWQDLTITDNGERVTAEITKEELEALPPYEYPQDQRMGTVFNTDQPVPGYGAGETDMAPADQSTAQTELPPAAGTPATTLHAADLIGLDLRTSADENVGKISDVVMSSDGMAEGVIVDIGGFLGVGAKPVMLEWDRVEVTQGENGELTAVAELSREELEQMPEYGTSMQ